MIFLSILKLVIIFPLFGPDIILNMHSNSEIFFINKDENVKRFEERERERESEIYLRKLRCFVRDPSSRKTISQKGLICINFFKVLKKLKSFP